jgi:hypothetical protein
VSITLGEVLDLARMGDVWLFRGRKAADRAIQVATSSSVNHVGMSAVIDDLSPLMWHAELGRSLPDLWSGTRHRGVQLHDLRQAVIVWSTRYGQQAWLRRLDLDAGPHPNPAKAADGKRMHKLALDSEAAPAVARIFAEFLAGHGIYAIAEGLTRDGIPSPSAHDPARNTRRSGIAWSKGAVRAILTNPRYTGY